MVKKVYIIEETDGICQDIVKNITKYLYNNKDKNSFSKIEILKNYKEQLDAERNSICQQNQDT